MGLNTQQFCSVAVTSRRSRNRAPVELDHHLHGHFDIDQVLMEEPH